MLSDQDIARIARAVRAYEQRSRNDAVPYRAQAPFISTGDAQHVRVTSVTPDTGRYPGKLLQYDAELGTWTDLADIWVVDDSGGVPAVATYLARKQGQANDRPVFTIDLSPTPPVDPDEKVKVSGDDTTAGHLIDKLDAGLAISLTEVSGGSNESLAIAWTGLTVTLFGLGTTFSDIKSISFDTASGITATEPTTDIAKVELISASVTQKGAVDTTTQSFAGAKTFTSLVTTTDDDGFNITDAADGIHGFMDTIPHFGIGAQFAAELITGPVAIGAFSLHVSGGVSYAIINCRDTADATGTTRSFVELQPDQITLGALVSNTNADWDLIIVTAAGTNTGQTNGVGGLSFVNGIFCGFSMGGDSGTAGQVLTSNGAGTEPTMQDVTGAGVTSLGGQTGATQTFVGTDTATIDITISSAADTHTFSAIVIDASITAGKLADDAVTTAKILDANVTTAKLADDAVTFAKFQNITGFSLVGKATTGTGNATNIALAVNQFLARASTGNIVASAISDNGLSLVGAADYAAMRALLAVISDVAYNESSWNGVTDVAPSKNAVRDQFEALSASLGDHGALAGLTDDDHTQYALLAGRSGGQTITGGTDPGDDLLLISTSDGSLGVIWLCSTGGDVYIGGGAGNASKLVLRERGAAGSNHISFQSPDLATDYEYVLPNAFPASNGYALVCTTAGVMSWAAMSGSVSDTVYGAGWNGDTTVAPSKNAVYDKIEAVIAAAQPLDATLTALAGQNWATDSTPVGTGADTVGQITVAANQFLAKASTGAYVAKAISDFALTILDDTTAAGVMTTLGLSANGQSLVTAANYAAMRALLDLEAGTDFYSLVAADAAFQPKDTQLTDIAGLAYTANALKVIRVNAGATAFELATPTAPSASTQAQQEAGTSADTYVAPATQQFHPSAAKFWVCFDGTAGTPLAAASYNHTSITDNGAGDYTLNVATDFSTASHAPVGFGTAKFTKLVAAPAAGTIRVECKNLSDANVDGAWVCVAAFGDQA